MENTLRSGEVKPILTIDVVNYSTRSSHEQVSLYKALVAIVQKSLPEEAKHPSKRIWSPSGDGGSLTFINTSFDAALMTAIYIARHIKDYNNGEFFDENSKALLPKPTEPLQIRTGVHSGPVSKDIDFDERENIWGDGINISARVMGMAKPDQIVISEDYYKDAGLSRDKDRPGIEITYTGKWWAKHNLPILLYNVYTERAGIPLKEVDEWFGPLHYPLENAIRIYEGMLSGESAEAEYPFRVAVIAKRILDLDPQNPNAKKALESLSKKRFSTSGNKPLFHHLFSDFSPATIRYFFAKSNFKVYEAGETVMTEGEKANSMMMIVSGQIKLYKSGQVVHKYNEKTESDEEYIFPEGVLIGEMGLFEVDGKRSATLQSSKRSMVLDIDYNFIRSISGSPNSGENMMRLEIQRGIWQLYTTRTIENKVIYHPLFDHVDEETRNVLKDHARFIPIDYQTPAYLSADEAWENLVIIINGNIKAYSSRKDSSPCVVEYGIDECLGAIRLVSEHNPYTQVEVAPGTQFICIPWDVIPPLRRKFDQFDTQLLKLGSIERRLRELE